jgi:hypothetical protein
MELMLNLQIKYPYGDLMNLDTVPVPLECSGK